jgi:hypothetical protein
MRKIFAIVFFSVTSAAVVAAPRESIYECEGLAGVDEYRIAIDLNRGEASFFDNDSIFQMILTQKRNLETLPPQTLIIFEGKEAGYYGALRLYFNLTRRNVNLYSIDKKGKQTEVGQANCVDGEPSL